MISCTKKRGHKIGLKSKISPQISNQQPGDLVTWCTKYTCHLLIPIITDYKVFGFYVICAVLHSFTHPVQSLQFFNVNSTMYHRLVQWCTHLKPSGEEMTTFSFNCNTWSRYVLIVCVAIMCFSYFCKKTITNSSFLIVHIRPQYFTTMLPTIFLCTLCNLYKVMAQKVNLL